MTTVNTVAFHPFTWTLRKVREQSGQLANRR